MNLTRLWLLPALLIQLIFVNTYAADNFKNGEQVNVWAVDGLPLKQEPSASAKNIMLMPYGQQVTVVGTFKSALPVNIKLINSNKLLKLTGNWIKISYKGRQGYVFGGYLSKMPVFIRGNAPGFESDEEYLKRNYGVSSTKIKKGKNDGNTTTILYKNGNKITSVFYDSCWDVEVCLKNITYREAILYAQVVFKDADAAEEIKIKQDKNNTIKISYYACT
jgi:hypothetical protein